MSFLTIRDIEEGKNLDFLGQKIDRKRMKDTAKYYVEKASHFFPYDTEKENFYPPIGFEATEREKEDYIYNLQFLTFQLSKALETDQKNMKELFSENPRLVVSLDNYCNKGCLHCIADSSIQKSEKLDYEDITGLDKRYFDIFKIVDFGRTGDPMLWESNNHTIADVIEHFADKGMKEVTVASGLFKNNNQWYENVVNKLENIRSEHKNLEIGAMLTYHHYFPDMKDKQIAKLFNKSLSECSKFSDKVAISLLGDIIYENSHTSNIKRTFLNNFDIIFDGFEIDIYEDNEIIAKKDSKETKISISNVSGAVYPFGRFEKTLKNDGLYEKYLKDFNILFFEPNLCPDVLEWPGMVVEPSGDINMCGAFEAIAKPHLTTISNILKPFEEVEDDLLKLHKKEKEWFLKNLPDIAFGKKSTCKIKNRCYSQ